ncbi:uncharacterized protein LOC144141711 [Haemaphysalis longicornis]
MAASVVVEVVGRCEARKTASRIEKPVDSSGDPRTQLSRLREAVAAAQKEANAYITELVDAEHQGKSGAGDQNADDEEEESDDGPLQKKAKVS